jgi:hypothetical protein
MRSAKVIVLALTLPFSILLARPARAQDVTPSQLRHMTAAQFQAFIDKEGAAKFTQRVTNDIDPHGQDEPNYDIILNHISSGDEKWLKIASEIGPYTQDPNFSKGLNVAIAYALLENPTAVLRMRNADDHFMNACMYPFPQPSETFLHNFQHHALTALTRVHDPALVAKKEDCRKELQTFPTEKASASF